MRVLLIVLAIAAVVVIGFVLVNYLPEKRVKEITKPANRPNIVLILTDDLDADSIAVMRQLKSLLIDQGTTFDNYFVSNPLCCPSRSSILRGQYAHNHQVLTNNPPNGGYQKFHALGHENSTIATWLQAAGYRTVLLGKYLNQYPAKNDPTHVPPGWDEWYGTNNFPHFFNYRITENGQSVKYGSRPQDYETDILSLKANDFIKRAAGNGVPFFMYLAPYAPHQPATPAPRHQREFENIPLPRPPSFNEADVSDKPQWIRQQAQLNSSEVTELEALYHKRLESLLAVDEMLASLIKTLKTTGQLENTFIFFSSDNGFHLGQHRLPLGKGTPYEEDIHVPLIVRGPGVHAGYIVKHLTLNIDLAPTFAALAGARTPQFVDGRSLTPLLGSNLPQLNVWRQSLLVEHWQFGANSNQGFQGLRTQDYLYVEWNSGDREFYNLRTDPYQLQSLHSTAVPSLMAQFVARLKKMTSCSATTCRTTEDLPFSIPAPAPK